MLSVCNFKNECHYQILKVYLEEGSYNVSPIFRQDFNLHTKDLNIIFLNVGSCKIRTLDKVLVQVIYLRSDPGNDERGRKETNSQNEVLCKGGCVQ